MHHAAVVPEMFMRLSLTDIAGLKIALSPACARLFRDRLEQEDALGDLSISSPDLLAALPIEERVSVYCVLYDKGARFGQSALVRNSYRADPSHQGFASALADALLARPAHAPLHVKSLWCAYLILDGFEQHGVSAEAIDEIRRRWVVGDRQEQLHPLFPAGFRHPDSLPRSQRRMVSACRLLDDIRQKGAYDDDWGNSAFLLAQALSRDGFPFHASFASRLLLGDWRYLPTPTPKVSAFKQYSIVSPLALMLTGVFAITSFLMPPALLAHWHVKPNSQRP